METKDLRRKSPQRSTRPSKKTNSSAKSNARLGNIIARGEGLKIYLRTTKDARRRESPGGNPVAGNCRRCGKKEKRG